MISIVNAFALLVGGLKEDGAAYLLRPRDLHAPFEPDMSRTDEDQTKLLQVSFASSTRIAKCKHVLSCDGILVVLPSCLLLCPVLQGH